MRRNALVCVLFLPAVLGGGLASANDLLQICGDGTRIDFSKSETTVDGQTFRTMIEKFDPVAGHFDVRLVRASDLSEREAHLQAILTTSITCIQFDSASIEVGRGHLDGDDWVHASGCIDQNLRMAGKC